MKLVHYHTFKSILLNSVKITVPSHTSFGSCAGVLVCSPFCVGGGYNDANLIRRVCPAGNLEQQHPTHLISNSSIVEVFHHQLWLTFILCCTIARLS